MEIIWLSEDDGDCNPKKDGCKKILSEIKLNVDCLICSNWGILWPEVQMFYRKLGENWINLDLMGVLHHLFWNATIILTFKLYSMKVSVEEMKDDIDILRISMENILIMSKKDFKWLEKLLIELNERMDEFLWDIDFTKVLKKEFIK